MVVAQGVEAEVGQTADQGVAVEEDPGAGLGHEGHLILEQGQNLRRRRRRKMGQTDL